MQFKRCGRPDLTCGRSAGRQFGVDVVVGAGERERVVRTRRRRFVVAIGGRAVPVVVAVEVEADVAEEPGRRGVAAQRGVARAARASPAAVAHHALLVSVRDRTGERRHARHGTFHAELLRSGPRPEF